MKKFFNNIYVFIALIFNLKIDIDPKNVKREMYYYFNANDWAYVTSITQIKTYRKDGMLYIDIETHRPGVLIGKAGQFINGLEAHLLKELKEPISIKISECKMWHNLYN